MRTRPEQVPGRRVAALALVAVRQELVAAQMDMPKMKSMAGMTTGAVPTIPPVTGYSEGQEILFLHTEASDPDIAKILTDMMGSAVLVVPSLATAPQEMLSRVYVCYQRPVSAGPMGPLGFQPDVFEKPPGDAGYTPLRNVVLVTWTDSNSARILKSAADVRDAISTEELQAEDSGIVVNMPMITWPGGQR